MGTLVFQANLGGAVNLVGPNTASTVNFTLPSADGSSGQALVTNGSGTLSFSSFVSAAAGSNTQVQFNSSGAFAGSANLTFNGTTLTAANTSVTTSETLSYGTANGVAYLNGSKVVTTGSALTFDGINLATNTGGTNATLGINSTSSSIYLQSRPDISYSRLISSAYQLDLTTVANQPISFGVNNAEAMRLTSTGLGIGTSSPTVNLHVYNASSAEIRIASANIGLQLYSSEGAGTSVIGTYTNHALVFRTNATERARIDSSGNLLVGTTSDAGLGITFRPSSTIIQNNNAEATGFTFSAFRRSSTTIGSITQSGTTAVLYNVTSDQRLKQNIVDADDASSLIDSLQVRQFDWKADGSHQRYGFVAQELATVAPEAVHQPADPEEMMAVDYSKLVPMLVKEIQSLRKRLAALEAK